MALNHLIMNKKTVRSSEGIFDTLSSVYSLKENQSQSHFENKSKAYVAAMRALQEKILIIESENLELSDKLTLAESKYSEKQQEWSIKLLEEKQKFDQTEKSLKFRINELEKIEKEAKKSLKKLEEIIKFLETKSKYNEDQVQRITDQCNIDKENKFLEVECLKNQINALKKQEKNFLTKIKTEE